jgi:uncharacterized membrane-anchored protein
MLPKQFSPDHTVRASKEMMSFEPHPMRGTVLREVHARPFSGIDCPRRVIHFAFMTDIDLAERDRSAFAAFCEARGQRGPEAHSRYHRLELSDCALRWEQHAEFTTYSWGFPSRDKKPFDTPATYYTQLMNDLPQPGPHIASVDLHYHDVNSTSEWQSAFDLSSLAACNTSSGDAIAATDFHVTTDGFVRILVTGKKLSPLRAGALVLQLLELETYRILSLLGLPIAQKIQPKIRNYESRLALITTEMMSTTGLAANRSLLSRLMELAGEIESEASQSQFRFGATVAYYQIVRARLADLKEVPFAGLQTIAGFMERRLAPAMRTCESIEQRLDKLSVKLSRAASLLRTRVDIELEQQNADLLATMSERTGLQLRLQQTVEGLSVAAISYYVVQLLFYVLAPIMHDDVSDGKWIKSAIVLMTVVCVIIVARVVRNRNPVK